MEGIKIKCWNFIKLFFWNYKIICFNIWEVEFMVNIKIILDFVNLVNVYKL